jgi:superfamily II DNA/RNA helicase
VTTQYSFADLGVGESMVEALTARGILSPFPIQETTLPDTLAGRDVLGRGKTGSGKTLAFSIPLVARLAAMPRRSRPTGLVLAPTRELATQIAATLEPLAAAHDLKVTTIFGGVPQHRQVAALRSGVDVVVACPGRLEDLMRQRIINLDAVEVTVVDEADHMADLGFLPGVTRILAATPARSQRLLFSATLDNGVDKLVRRFIRNPVTHSIDEAHSPVPEMTHHVFHVADVDAKKELVRHLASGSGRRILFMRTKHQARKLARQLTESGVPSVDLHGNLSQPARDRNLAAFAAGAARVLVATDIAARGVHVDAVELVVHVDPPVEHKAYLHRSGRTARAGNAGDVVTVALPEQRKELQLLMRRAGINVRPQEVEAHSASVRALVGDVAPYQAPAARNDSSANVGTPKAAGSRRRRSARRGRTQAVNMV